MSDNLSSALVTILASDPLWADPKPGYAQNIFAHMANWQHEIGATGGYISATITLTGTIEWLDEWFVNGLGRHIVIKDNVLNVVWEGFVNRVVYNYGEQSFIFGPLSQVANRVKLLYTPYTDITVSPPTTGTQTETTYGEDTDSQAKWGIREAIITEGNLIVPATIGGGGADQATQTRDAKLDYLKNPERSQEIQYGGSVEPSMVLECLGYSAMFDMYTHTDNNTGYLTYTDKVLAVLASDPNSIFSSDESQIETNNLLTRALDRDRTATEILNEIAGWGGSAYEHWMWGVGADRVFYYIDAPTQYDYIYSHGKLYDYNMRLLYPWQVTSGRWIYYADKASTGAPVPTDRTVDPQSALFGFIEKVAFSSPYSVQISGRRVATKDAAQQWLTTKILKTVRVYEMASTGTFAPIYSKYDVDAPPVSPSALDDEFSNGAVGVLWTEYDHGGLQTPTEDNVGLHLGFTGNASVRSAGLYQAIPAGAFTIETKVSTQGFWSGASSFGLALFEDATNPNGDFVAIRFGLTTTTDAIAVTRYSAWNALSANLAVTTPDYVNETYAYLRIRRTGTTYYFEYSADGIGWTQIYTTGALGFVPTSFGPIAVVLHTTPCYGVFRFFRYLASDVGHTAPILGQLVPVGGGSTSITVHNDLTGIQGGAPTQYYHLTAAEYAALHPAVTVSDTNSIDLTLAIQALSADLRYQDTNSIDLGVDAGGLKGDLRYQNTATITLSVDAGGLKADAVAGSSIVLMDTRENIMGVAPTSGALAYATDYEKFYIGDGTYWYQIPITAVYDTDADMGYTEDSALSGYGDDYISDKQLSNCLIGGNARTENGGIRIDVTQDPDTFEIYLRNMWNTIIYDLTVAYGDLRHTPLTEQIYVWRGDSVITGLNGQPVIQEYEVSMGAMPGYRVINGGTF